MLSKNSRLKGITLIELVIVLAIVAILVAVGVPAYTNFTQEYRLSSSVENLFQMIQYARSEAIKRGSPVYVSFTTGNTWCYGLNTGSACNCANPSSCNLGTSRYSGPQQLSLSVTGFSSNSFYFKSIHAGASTTGDITFTPYGQSSPLITIHISRLGNPTICATGISGYTAC